jgi:hypothetical protein
MATHNIDDGTGGLDASLYYELDRAEVQSKAFSMNCNHLIPFHRTSVMA